MSPTDEEPGGRSWLRYYGEELQRERELKGMSLRMLAGHTSYSYQQISNVEAGRRTPSGPFTREIDAALETGGRFERILRRVLRDTVPDWFAGAAREEARATRIRTYQTHVVHGLLQTEAYARELIRGANPSAEVDWAERIVAARMSRGSILTGDNSPMMWAILDEAVLRRPIGSPAVMVEQMERLLKVSEEPRTMIQILPFSAGAHAGTDGSFTLWSYADRTDVMYLEGMATGLVVQGERELDAARFAYDHLQAAALPANQSLDLIRATLKDYTWMT